jgi:nesprin-1
LNAKYIQVKRVLDIIKDLSQNCTQIDKELQDIAQNLSNFNPYSKDIEQNTQNLDQIGSKLTNYNKEIKKIISSLSEFEEFISPELRQYLRDLELKSEKLMDMMDEYNRAFNLAKNVRNEYLFNIEKVHCWLHETEEKLKSHYAEPLEYKVSIYNSIQEKPNVIEWFENTSKNGKIIERSTHDENEIFNVRQNLGNTRERLDHIFSLLDNQKVIIDNVVDAWTKFMELYQIIVNWASEKKIFINQEMRIKSQQEAHEKLNEYSVKRN